ncbi:hypothetical protein BJ508DRAFT_325595 [Ascobolus immersus RN42]|uniref:Uncharacterized protein n=1 Tax=Ascobolus immersus RN42 TaxID=1160509 RepID=A0A3N4IL36_ASCIM|nr:hypothetical protein BJ508DRAFT_325595 [Ascobolus immersus RN42]
MTTLVFSQKAANHALFTQSVIGLSSPQMLGSTSTKAASQSARRLPLEAIQTTEISHTHDTQRLRSLPPSSSSNSTAILTSSDGPTIDIRLSEGKVVEMHDGSFLRIKKLIKRDYCFEDPETPCFLLSGPLFRRTRLLHCYSELGANKQPMPFRTLLNEVVMVCDEVVVPVEDIVWGEEPFKKLIVTNAEFPKFKNTGWDGWLVCRWKYCRAFGSLDQDGKDNCQAQVGGSEISGGIGEGSHKAEERPGCWAKISAEQADPCYKV